MNKIEKKLLIYIEKHLSFMLLTVCMLLGLAIRYALKDFTSADYVYSLQPWYKEIAENGISKQVGDYNLLYQMVIYVMTMFHIRPLYAYKIFSCFFDMALAFTIADIVSLNSARFKKEKATLAYCFVWLSPIIVLNSAAWAQCDAIYSFFCLFSILLLEKKHYCMSLCFLGIAFAFKLQTVFLLPLFFFLYFKQKNFSIVQFALIPLSMLGISFPAVLGGRKLTEVFTIYTNQANTYQSISENYPSVWLLLCKAGDGAQYDYMKIPTICITIFVLTLIMFRWLKKDYKIDGKNLYIMAYLLCYTCVFFLPSMHERYGFLYEVLSIALAIMIPKMAPLSVALICVSMNTYGSFLFGRSLNLPILSWLNLAIYILSIFILEKEMGRETTEREDELHEK